MSFNEQVSSLRSDTSDVSSQSSEEEGGYLSPAPTDIPPNGPLLNPREAVIMYRNALSNGNFQATEGFFFFFGNAGILSSEPRRYAEIVASLELVPTTTPALRRRLRRQAPATTAIHDLIADSNRDPIAASRWNEDIARILHEFERRGSDMYIASSGYPESRIHPGVPTVNPVFFAAHKNRSYPVLAWYFDKISHIRTGPKIHSRPLLWWLVRKADPVDQKILRCVTAYPCCTVNFGLETARHTNFHLGGNHAGSHIDFTPLDLALLRQPPRVIEYLREMKAVTSLEAHAPRRLKKLYRPGPDPWYGDVRSSIKLKRRSSFGFAEETLSGEEGLRVREPGSQRVETHGERAIFWVGKPYGPLPRPHGWYSRTLTDHEAANLWMSWEDGDREWTKEICEFDWLEDPQPWDMPGFKFLSDS